MSCLPPVTRRRLGRRCIASAVATTVLCVPAVLLTPPTAVAATDGADFVADNTRISDAPLPTAGSTIQVTGRLGVPTTSVTAIIGSITLIGPASDNWFSVTSTDGSTGGQVLFGKTDHPVTNQFVAGLNADGAIKVFGGTSAQRVVIDLQGYFTTAGSTAGGFVPVAQTRLLDTRQSTPVAAKSKVIVTVPSSASQQTLSGVYVNTTVVTPTVGGNLDVGVTTPLPTTSIVFNAGETRANTTVTSVNSSESFEVYNDATAPINVVVDLEGGYVAGGGAGLHATAGRIYDSRQADGSLNAGERRTVPILGLGGVPDDQVGGVYVDLLTTGQSAPGNLKVWATGQDRPNTSVGNFTSGVTSEEGIVTEVGPDGTITVENSSSGILDLVVDVSGYYDEAPNPVKTGNTGMIGVTSPTQLSRPPEGGETHQYYGLGDSYSAAYGLPNPTTQQCVSNAHPDRSKYSYVPRWRNLSLQGYVFYFGACSGSLTRHVYQQVHQLNTVPGVITITIGGNDIGFGVVARCFAHIGDPRKLSRACKRAHDDAIYKTRTTLGPALYRVYSYLGTYFPRDRIVVVDYPYIFQPGTCGLAEPLAIYLNQIQTGLNDKIHATVLQANRDHQFHGYYLDAVPAFRGHGVCGARSRRYFQYTNGHPNQAGMGAITRLFTQRPSLTDGV